MQPITRTTFASCLLAGVAIAALAGTAEAAARLAGPKAPVQRIDVVAYLAERADALPASCDGRENLHRSGCAALQGYVADARRAAIYTEMAKTWDAERRAAFARLLETQEAFARAVGTYETDRLPSGGAEVIRAQQTEKGAFLVLLRSVVGGNSRLQFVDYAESDSALNATYAQVMAAHDTMGLAWGTVEKAGIRKTQRAWLAYRDAFTTFAATFNAGVADSVKAELTTRRAMSLEGFLAD